MVDQPGFDVLRLSRSGQHRVLFCPLPTAIGPRMRSTRAARSASSLDTPASNRRIGARFMLIVQIGEAWRAGRKWMGATVPVIALSAGTGGVTSSDRASAAMRNVACAEQSSGKEDGMREAAA